MNRKKITELDKLFLEIGTYRKSSEFKELFEFVRRFPHIAPYNAMLIHIQKPGSQYVASAAEWMRIFNRRVKTGARPLVILRPFGPVAFVFELGDTEGDEPFPEDLINPFKVKGEVSDYYVKNLINNMKCEGISYLEADHGTSSAGFIKTCYEEKATKIIRNKKEILIKVLFEMVVNRNHPKETQFSTILHELGHAYCGHICSADPKLWIEGRFIPKNECEFEAESVCWLICERMGIKNPSAEYLSGYLNSNNEIPNISIDAVLKATGIIETLIKENKEPRKDLILNK
ncbi:MAG TPA: hypothetical protein PK733_12850 [Clostridiales bacterium]|nr:hypothetical protein [Clostridiales bacterium]